MLYDFSGRVAVITGSAHGIGLQTKKDFEKCGCKVYGIDLMPGESMQGDIGDRETLEKFASLIREDAGHVDFLIHNAPPLMKGIRNCSYEEFEASLRVGVTAPFYLTKLLLPLFDKGGCVINISSSRDRMSEAQTESYSAAKGGISALTHAMAASLAGKIRVNSISPGWIGPHGAAYSQADMKQHPAGRVGEPSDISGMILFLCSDQAGFITGENICIDGGMTHLMVYHEDGGWTYDPDRG